MAKISKTTKSNNTGYLDLSRFPLEDRLNAPELMQIVEDTLHRYGGVLKMLDMAEVYEQTGFEKSGIRNLNTTALCDGKTIYLHDRISEVGPIRRVLDTVHLFGHALAWHISDAEAQKTGIIYHGEKARRIAAEDQRGASKEKLREVETYEIEANSFLLGIVDANKQRIQKELRISESDYIAIQDHLRSVCALDTYYVVQFYLQPNVAPFRDFMEGRTLVDLNEVARIKEHIVPLALPSPETTQFCKIEKIPLPVVIGINPEMPASSKRPSTKPTKNLG